MTPITTLRQRLLQDLRANHERLDEGVSRFDLATRSGLVGFLQMHEAALTGLVPRAPQGALREAMGDLPQRAAKDLVALEAPRLTVAAPQEIHPLALDYVICGSRLGATVLQKRWQAGGQAPAGARYMAAPDYIDLWRAFCETARLAPGHGVEADAVLADAARLFDHYALCALRADPSAAKEGTLGEAA